MDTCVKHRYDEVVGFLFALQPPSSFWRKPESMPEVFMWFGGCEEVVGLAQDNRLTVRGGFGGLVPCGFCGFAGLLGCDVFFIEQLFQR